MVDTSVWSLAFRRDGEQRAPQVTALRAALDGADSIVITGIIRGAADTSFISQEVAPGSVGERARNGRLLPGDVIVPPAVWLCTDATNGVTGVRAVGRNWDKAAPSAEEAFSKCLDPHIDVPRIM
jgi:hypothetical protein